jgi:hypothetical protein
MVSNMVLKVLLSQRVDGVSDCTFINSWLVPNTFLFPEDSCSCSNPSFHSFRSFCGANKLLLQTTDKSFNSGIPPSSVTFRETTKSTCTLQGKCLCSIAGKKR